MAPRRITLAALALATAAIALAAWQHERVLEKVLWLRYWQTLATPQLPPATDPAQARREDLDFLARLPDVDRSFTEGTRAEFARRVARLRDAAESLDDVRFMLGVAHAAAAAGNGHTQLEGEAWRARLASLPVRLAWFGDALHVVRVRSGNEALLGARVLALGGVDPPRLLASIRPYVSGTPERARAVSPMLLELPAVLAALGAQADASRVEARVRLPEGGEQVVGLEAIRPDVAPAATTPGRALAPDPIEGEDGAWRTLPSAGSLGSLRGAAALFHAERLRERTLYLHPWRVSRGFDASVGRALEGALGADGDPPWQRIVLDLRFNDGGEYPMVYRALSRLPRRLAADGGLAILTDATTYSGAIVAAALAKHFTGARARVFGARAGDALAFWAEGTRIELPHSRLRVSIATGRHDWARGCREWRCYWPNVFRGVAVGSVDPDVSVAWRFEDYARGVDTVLDAALEWPPWRRTAWPRRQGPLRPARASPRSCARWPTRIGGATARCWRR